MPIIFARHHETGSSMPFDVGGVSGTTAGAFAVIAGRAYPRPAALAAVSEREGVSTRRAEELLDERDAWRLSHFATCPKADSHRRRTGGGQPRPISLGGSGPEQQTLL